MLNLLSIYALINFGRIVARLTFRARNFFVHDITLEGLMQAAIQFFRDALRHEMKASAFYSKAAEITRDDESRMLFIKLSGMEDDHANQLVAKIKKAPCAQGLDVDSFVRALESDAEATISDADLHTITNGTVRQVLELAIGYEKQAVQNYENLANESTDAEVKAHCFDAVQEEGSHVRELTNLLNSLDMSEEDRPGL